MRAAGQAGDALRGEQGGVGRDAKLPEQQRDLTLRPLTKQRRTQKHSDAHGDGDHQPQHGQLGVVQA
ncbi:Uncharacterised protein [Mycobacteroides abscessus subsp. abscessus]|nr:Uncharacterised protein [Mycobacteroides abscessus subsp. abscessus]